jgi:acyl carrier protein
MAIEAQIREYVDKKLIVGGGRQYGNDDSFLQAGIVDSIGILELASFIEEKFGVVVEDEEMVPDNFDSVNSLASYIRQKKGL